MHIIESLVDIIQFLMMGNKLVNPECTLEVIYELDCALIKIVFLFIYIDMTLMKRKVKGAVLLI